MKLYPVPGGTWEGTEADWKGAMKDKGLNPKDYLTADKKAPTREVPTGKKELIEFLNFFAVDVYRLPAGATPDTVVDHAALQAKHNPNAPDLAAPPVVQQVDDIDVVFNGLHINTQLRLAVVAIDNATGALRDKPAA
jgi:hypothetical protein